MYTKSSLSYGKYGRVYLWEEKKIWISVAENELSTKTKQLT